MATESLSTFPAGGTPSLGADLIYANQAGVDVKMTPNQFGIYNGGVLMGTPSNPTGTTSLTGVMMGLGQLFTPGFSTRILVHISGLVANSLINDGYTIQVRYGTGTAPANGDALTGTAIGAAQSGTSLIAADKKGFSLPVIITGLTIATQYWIDISLAAVTAGTATATNISVIAHEV